jgi:hypothetical protein
MESIVTDLFNAFSEMKIWALFIQAFSIYTIVSMFKKLANAIVDYVSAKWRFGPSCKVRYNKETYQVESVGLFTIQLSDPMAELIISTSEWKKLTIIIEKH